MRSKKKLQIAKQYTNTNFSFKEELAITIIDQMGPIIGGALTLAAALIERATILAEKEDEKR